MKKVIGILILICAWSAITYSQDKLERKVIEVSGSAERLITPDVFTFKITLTERLDKKDKIGIEQQEDALRKSLTGIGVDVAKDLSVYDISSTYFRQKKVRDVLGSKDYRLKIRDLNVIAKLQDVADQLNVSKLDLIDTESSEITRFRRETKIDAIKAARDKADYLLSAIGSRIGGVVYVKEVEEEMPRQISRGVINYQSNASNISTTSDTQSDLAFTQIKIRYEILARFEIE